MNDKLQKKLRNAEEEFADEAVASHLDEHRRAAALRAMYVLGGVNTANRVATSLSSEAVKTLITFQEQKMHEDIGFTTFVDFLENSEYSPMTKTQFYERKALLEKEGDALFDLMTELGMSIRKRKLLGKGNVELCGEILVVHSGDEVTEISVHDRSSILDAITALADANAEKSVKLTVQKEKIEKHDEKVRELYDDLDRIKAAKIADIASNPHMIARVELGLAFNRLTAAAANLSAIEKDQLRDGVFEDIAAWRSDLSDAYKTDTKRPPVETKLLPDDTIETGFNRYFEDNKLAELL